MVLCHWQRQDEVCQLVQETLIAVQRAKEPSRIYQGAAFCIDTTCTMETMHMYYLTRKQYMDLTKESRQNVSNKIKRGTLRTAKRKAEVDQEFIELSQGEYEHITQKDQSLLVDSVHGKK